MSYKRKDTGLDNKEECCLKKREFWRNMPEIIERGKYSVLKLIKVVQIYHLKKICFFFLLKFLIIIVSPYWVIMHTEFHAWREINILCSVQLLPHPCPRLTARSLPRLRPSSWFQVAQLILCAFQNTVKKTIN